MDNKKLEVMGLNMNIIKKYGIEIDETNDLVFHKPQYVSLGNIDKIKVNERKDVFSFESDIFHFCIWKENIITYFMINA